MAQSLDTGQITDWRSIVTLIVFVLTNIVVLFPFHVPIYVPRRLSNAFLDTLSKLRIIAPRKNVSHSHHKESSVVRLSFPIDFLTAPLIADLFLLAILAIGRQEVVEGTWGANNISPLDIMVFFITLAYIAISIDASGLIRYLAFKVLQKGGKVGHRLFFYLYAFFFLLGSAIGNDPIILSGTAFLAYMTRVSSNIIHPRAWIHTQFAIANIASAILVSSNPTNLVLAGAFKIKFIDYTANMIVPVVITAIVLFPFLLYIIFAEESLIPYSIKMHELSEEAKAKKPVNPNIPNARGNAEEEEMLADDSEGKLLSLEEIMNPFLDKGGAAFGAVIMTVTLVTLLALNASSSKTGGHAYPVFWVTLPAAFVMLIWDIGFGWLHRKDTRDIAKKGRQEIEDARAQRAIREEEEAERARLETPPMTEQEGDVIGKVPTPNEDAILNEKKAAVLERGSVTDKQPEKTTLVSLTAEYYRWAQETFPTVTAVLAHLPFALIPFAFTMFILVQALVTKGWVEVFAHGWDHWVNKTGTVGAIGGMGFISVILSNFAGTNIGATILLSRTIQAWSQLHTPPSAPITNRTFWATVYAMALGVNYGAFSTAFSASLAGMLWRDILERKHIKVRRLEFARVNLPIIVVSMVVGCAVLVGEVYIIRGTEAYVPAL